jgi:membrane-bound lytic murein transglycosylase MltF
MKTTFFTYLTSCFLALFTIIFTMGGRDASAVESILKLHQKWTGDFDGMVERHQIRALVPSSKTFYFLDKGVQRGATYEALKLFEKQVNKQLKKETLTVRVLVIPTKRDRLLPALVEGLGDIAAGNLTITSDRQKLVDFSNPVYTGVDEIIVTGPASPPVNTLDDLSGKEIHVRASSSYYESLKSLNARFKKDGKKQMKLVLADEYLEDEDLLEMMNANLIPMIVIDSHKARFWKQIFKDLTLHPDIKLRTGGRIAWAIRKNSPKLKDVINAFVKTHKIGTLTGNILLKRYLENTQWVRNPLNREDRKRFQEAIEFFKNYSNQYGFDWLMVGALAYQESRIDQSKRSHVGAIGVMQILKKTAMDPNVNIPEIEELEKNIHAGVKYLRFMRDRYFEKAPMDKLNKMLFSFASYNAGPARVAKLRKEAVQSGLDPNVWFGNVEIVAAKRIGRETVQYVGNIYKYYIAYRLSVDKFHKKEEAKRGYGK